MGNAARAFVLLLCSAAVAVLLRSGPGIDTDQPGGNGAAFFFVAMTIVPWVMAVIVAWRGHDR